MPAMGVYKDDDGENTGNEKEKKIKEKLEDSVGNKDAEDKSKEKRGVNLEVGEEM
jgi:hypothetical protein